MSYSVQQGVPRMTRFLLKFSLVLLAAFAVLSAAPSILGRTTPHNSTLAGFTEGCENQSQPCWYGVVPGETTDTEAYDLLKERSFSITQTDDYWRFYYLGVLPDERSGCSQFKLGWKKDESTIDVIYLLDCKNIDLSDILFLVRYPGTIHPGCRSYSPLETDSVRYPYSTIEIKNTPVFYGPNEVSRFSLYEGLYDSLGEIKDLYENSYKLGIANETDRWKFLRVFLEISGCG